MRPPDLVADAIEEGGSQERLKGTIVPRFERAEALDHLRDDVLHQIVCIESAACPRWQAAVRPFLQARQVPGAEVVERNLIARPRAREQLNRRHRAGSSSHRWAANGP